jgi:hypothetical protein
MSYSMSYLLKLGAINSGLSLKVNLYNYANLISQSGITSSFYEIANGDYYWYYNNFPAQFRGYGRILTSSNNYLTSFAVNPEEGEYLDQRISSITLNGNGSLGFDVYTFDNFGDVVPNTTVQIKPSGSNNLVGIGFSNANNGKTTFNLGSGIYEVSVYNIGVAGWANPYYVAVYDAGQTLYASGTRIATPTYPSTGLTRIYVYINDIGLDPQEGVLMQVYPSGIMQSSGYYLFTSASINARSDDDGFIYCDVQPSEPVRVVVDQAKYQKTFIVPASGVINILTV